MSVSSLLLLLAVGCGKSVDSAAPPDSTATTDSATGEPDSGPDSDTTGGEAPWTGAASVQVTDPDGAPLEGAVVMMGGASEAAWARTDAGGNATVEVTDDGVSDRYLLAGLEGWTSAGVELEDEPLTGVLVIALQPLPTSDNPDYAFQPGGDGSSPNTSECGHCHWTIGDDWAASSHAASARNPNTWDLYTGSAVSADEAACEALAGAFAEGLAPGAEAALASRCYVPKGVLPWLNGCEVESGQGCDHPDRSGAVEHYGGCAECHAPAMDGGVPGEMNLVDAHGVASEGVTCDFCHKVREVTPGGAGGLDGGISLLRPSEPSEIVGLEYAPITFGPYPDVIVPIMNGSYAPQMREAGWCSSCHEYTQPALHPEQRLDDERWPDGLPILETFSEFEVYSGGNDALSCGTCHMPTLSEESSTYDITALGLQPSVAQGWLRESGEVRHHSFPGADALGAPVVSLALVEVDGAVEATVTVANYVAGHAVPTGEPMKQLLVLVSAVDDSGDGVPAVGGQVIADVGGALAEGAVGAGVIVDGLEVRFVGQALPEAGLVARFVRPTGSWVDYPGPGVGRFSDETLSAEEKGVEGLEYLGEVAVTAVDGDALTLAAPPPETAAGDRVYLVGEGHYAGAPGWLYAKVLVDAEGSRGVAHYRAVDVASDDRIAPGGSGVSAHRFPLPTDGGGLTVTATLLRRGRAATVADHYRWDPADTILTSVQRASHTASGAPAR